LPDSLSTRKNQAAAVAVGFLERRLERKLGAKRETIQNQKSETQEKQKRKKERGWRWWTRVKYSRLDNVAQVSFFSLSLSLLLSQVRQCTGRDCLLYLFFREHRKFFSNLK